MADADKYPATLAGIDLEIQDIGDDFSKSIIRHEFANRDGALLEDMGQNARRIRFTAFFLNADYDRHQDLLDLLEVADTFELVHPKYGVLVGSIEHLHVRHNDRQQCAEIDISFVEDLVGTTEEYTVEFDVEREVEDAYNDGMLEAMSQFGDDMQTDLSSLSGVSAAAQQYQSELSGLVNQFNAAMTQVANPANSLLAATQFTADLPGQVIRCLANTVERYSLLNANLATAPARFVASFRSGIVALQASLPQTTDPTVQAAIDTFSKHLSISAAQRLALDLAAIYKADEQVRTDRKKTERTRSFDARGNFLGPDSLERIMTIAEIEQTLADARTELQAAVTSARNMRSLQAMAAQLLYHVNIIKVERERLIQVQVDNTMPLHLLCLSQGLPYNTAERIHAINRIKHPNFVSGEVSVYVQ